MDMTINSELQHAAQQGEAFILLPFSALYLSKENVRKKPGQMPIPDLAESIAQHGLMQNLLVEAKAGKNKSHTHGVVAGGRRFQAIQLLVKDGRWKKDQPVPVKVVSGSDVTSTSLIENIAREAMHPADELDAWIKLSSDGVSLETISSTFGVSEMTVRRRLKLASLSPKLLKLLRTDEITLEQLGALALADSHEEQESAWFDFPSDWQRQPDEIRDRLTSEEIDANKNRIAKFVGLQAYEQAGGHVRRDLFSDESTGYITDAALLHKLCNDKLNGIAQKAVDAGWSWVEVRNTYDYTEFNRYGRMTAEIDLSNKEAVAKQIESLEEKHRKLSQEAESLWENDSDEDCRKASDLEDQARAVEDEIERIRESHRAWTPQQLASGGALFYLDHSGNVEVRYGLVRPSAKPVDANGDVIPLTNSLGIPVKTQTKAVHSDSLVRHLTAHRTIAVQAVMSKRVDVALALLAFRLATEVFEPSSYGVSNPLQVRGTVVSHQLESAAGDMSESAAWQAIESLGAEWRSRLPKDVRDWFQWLLQSDQQIVLELLTFCVAVHTDGIRHTEGSASSLDGVADALGFDMADHWTPTATSYFGRVSKAQIAATVTEALSAEAAAPLASMKKAAAAAEAERLMAGVRWVPEPMRNRSAQPVRGTADSSSGGDDDMADEGDEE